MAAKVAMDSEGEGAEFPQVRHSEQRAANSVQEGVPDAIRVGADLRWGRA